MNLVDLTDRAAVIKATEEFNRLGREAFLSNYGFGPARSYFLLYKGARYDSKAITGVAYGYQHPDRGPLGPGDFSGGEDTVARRLRALGFEVSKSGFETREIRAWALCANPKRYRIADAVKNLEIDHWTIGRSDIRSGDRVLIWQTRHKQGRRGIVAFGKVLEDPEVRTDLDNPYWVDPSDGSEFEARVAVQYISAPNLPLWVDDSPIGSYLGSLSVARSQGGTAFQVTQEQWQKVVEQAGDTSLPSLDETETIELVRYRSKKGGQGFGLSPKERALVEKYAMNLAGEYLSNHWDEVIDVSARASFDFLCRRGTDELRVEVKGTTTLGEKIVLTKNELAKASEPDYGLFVVSEIELLRELDNLEVKGGICTFFWPWHQERHKLEPLSYSCVLDWSDGKRVPTETDDSQGSA